MSDIISQAMGILGGGKKKDEPAQPREASRKAIMEQSPVRTGAHAPAPTPAHGRTPAQVRDRLTVVERKVVGELARYAALHAQVIEIRQRMEKGDSHQLVESRLEETLKAAKVTIK
jgi:hypothetical protein